MEYEDYECYYMGSCQYVDIYGNVINCIYIDNCKIKQKMDGVNDGK